MHMWIQIRSRRRIGGLRRLRVCGRLCVGALLLAAGCAHDRSGEREVLAPRLPVFFGGPASLLLTNGGGFSARLTEQPGVLAVQGGEASGQLLAQGAKLRFEPELTGSADKAQRAAGFSYLWDVAEGSGYILSEPLQGYAPVSPGLRATNVVWQSKGAASQKVAGHPCEVEQATVQRSDGSSVAFEVWRATDLAGFPMQITSANNSAPLTLSLSKVRVGPVRPEVFAVPDGFTKYASVEAMVMELTVRQHSLKRTAGESDDLGVEVEPPRPR
jgi:hypothetical protein